MINLVLDLQSNYKVHNYDTNKLTSFLVNDLIGNLIEYSLFTRFTEKF